MAYFADVFTEIHKTDCVTTVQRLGFQRMLFSHFRCAIVFPVISARTSYRCSSDTIFLIEMPHIVLFYVSLLYSNGMIIIRRRITQPLVLAERC